jgi:hypothetical protein
MLNLNYLRRSIQWLVIFALFQGCSRYQYVMVGSRLPLNENQEFFVENDTVSIRYSFSGQNFPLTVTVYNKLLQPVYFDLGRTTVIINNVQSDARYLFEGQSDFIAPQAFASIKSIPLRDQLFDTGKQDPTGKKPRMTTAGKVYSYDESTTPLPFRIILALSPNEDYSYPTFYDYSFWVSDLIVNSTNPKSMNYKPSNQFYIKKTTIFGNALSWTGMAALVVIGAMLGVESE